MRCGRATGLLELFPDGGEAVVLTEGLALGNAMQLGRDGWLYYPHMLTGQVWRVPPGGGAPELVAEEVHEPVAVRLDPGGALHVLSRGVEGIINRINLHGDGSRALVASGLVGLDNAAFDADNRTSISSYASGGISELHPDGRTREIAPCCLDGPYGLTGRSRRHGVRGRPLPAGESRINLAAPFLLACAVLPHMLAAGVGDADAVDGGFGVGAERPGWVAGRGADAGVGSASTRAGASRASS